MDLLALWGKNSCSLVLKTCVRRTSRAQLATLSQTPRKYWVKQGGFMYRFGPKLKNGPKLIWEVRFWEDRECINGCGVVLMSLVGGRGLSSYGVGRGNECKKMIFVLSVACPSVCPVLSLTASFPVRD